MREKASQLYTQFKSLFSIAGAGEGTFVCVRFIYNQMGNLRWFWLTISVKVPRIPPFVLSLRRAWPNLGRPEIGPPPWQPNETPNWKQVENIQVFPIIGFPNVFHSLFYFLEVES